MQLRLFAALLFLGLLNLARAAENGKFPNVNPFPDGQLKCEGQKPVLESLQIVELLGSPEPAPGGSPHRRLTDGIEASTPTLDKICIDFEESEEITDGETVKVGKDVGLHFTVAACPKKCVQGVLFLIFDANKKLIDYDIFRRPENFDFHDPFAAFGNRAVPEKPGAVDKFFGAAKRAIKEPTGKFFVTAIPINGALAGEGITTEILLGAESEPDNGDDNGDADRGQQPPEDGKSGGGDNGDADRGQQPPEDGKTDEQGMGMRQLFAELGEGFLAKRN
ncbi:unnamed protein product [Vitrella brassicaformis CCMP3155]|uniref:Uncharacterized protein n=1 Tax=Vitrella brassicaformis (strain CCMP3155) TaxID=1169540 RepID=A0A0G4E888_VITBC|nr:unnamed protein product [Vitrella brassicaformis CCMP3155]|eukprot:CEL91826.1 unnamed protein product [Vitrella brassicaformis CCMP3155]